MGHIKTVQLTFTGDFDHLNDAKKCEDLLTNIVNVTGLTTLRTIKHVFEPQGISIVKLLSESHIALHTWPETTQGYITLTTCNSSKLDEEQIASVLSRHKFSVQLISSVGEGAS